MNCPPSERLTFFRSLLRNPKSVGSVIPSSPGLSKAMVSHVDPASHAVLEVGAGTGPITRALLRRGVPSERLFVIERDASLAAYLRRTFPGVNVLCGDAAHARQLLANAHAPEISTVVSSVPFRNLEHVDRMRIMRGMMGALSPEGQLLQFTYAEGCPVPSRTLGLRAERIGRVWLNFPPAVVWRFTRQAESSATSGLPRTRVRSRHCAGSVSRDGLPQSGD